MSALGHKRTLQASWCVPLERRRSKAKGEYHQRWAEASVRHQDRNSHCI